MGRRDEERGDGSRCASRSRSQERTRDDDRDRKSVSSRSRRRSRSAERSASRNDWRKRASLSRSVSPAATRDQRSARRSVSAERTRKDRRSRSHSNSRDRSSHRRRRERSASVSASDSDSSSDSSSSSESEDERRRSKSKRSHRKKDSKKHKKHKKDERKKKDKKKDKKKKKKKSSSHAVNQNAYGKYGILRESDFHTKSQSFQAWLRDIKSVTEFNGPKWEAMEMFKEYMEDYNTATMPHEKYYDIEKYEMRKYAKEQQKRAKQQLTALGAAVPDEAAFQRERQAQRLAREQEDFKLVLQTMDKDKIEAMRRQEQLRAQMQMQYKAGNVAEARRLEQLLKADEEDRRAK